MLKKEEEQAEEQNVEEEGGDEATEEDSEYETATDSEEDDLVITLDENATDYEPSQSKFQRTVPQLGQPGIPGADAGADTTPLGTSSIPGLGVSTARVAIGGIPRSAIPGLAISFAAAAQHQAGPGPSRLDKSQEKEAVPAVQLRIEDAVFPSEWQPGLPIKLPGQTRVSPEEYKEFLNLGHGEIFSLDIDSVVDAPWRLPGTDPSDFFNYGMTISGWKAYQDRVKQYRAEFMMKGQIQTLDQSQAEMAQWHAPVPPQNVLEEEGDRSLHMSMLDARDESYDAFVTSERPEVCMTCFHFCS